MGLSLLEKRMLIDGARGAVKDYLERGTLEEASSPAQDLSKALREVRGVFVTLYQAGKPRGCMGMPSAVLPLWQACRFCALNAACRDPRFPPLAVEDLAGITFEIALIGEPRPFEEVSQIRGGTCGLILQKGFRREVFMPGAFQEIAGAGKRSRAAYGIPWPSMRKARTPGRHGWCSRSRGGTKRISRRSRPGNPPPHPCAPGAPPSKRCRVCRW